MQRARRRRVLGPLSTLDVAIQKPKPQLLHLLRRVEAGEKVEAYAHITQLARATAAAS
jgi:antitoxin (DNA-binding transcriptional repressor) of toxin-antitoxin stability system